MDIEKRSLVGCCGLYCGLCTKFQSTAKSRCIGCKLGEQHSWCSIWNCCVKKRGFETCAECPDVPNCDIFVRRNVAEWFHAMENLRLIMEGGLESWLQQQEKRQALVEDLLSNYNEGRSMNFYCKACTRMPVALVSEAIKEARKRITSQEIERSDMKSKAKVAKQTIKRLASTHGVELK